MTRARLVMGAMLVLAVMVFSSPVSAGDLNPPGPPAPTMSTLNRLQPTWDQKLPANDGPLVNGQPDPCNSSRFKCVLGGAAVLDKETGLVWDKDFHSSNGQWLSAVTTCIQSSAGGRLGWRLPTLDELESLIDPTVPSTDPRIPAGHPFGWLLPFSMIFWSATTNVADTSRAWAVDFWPNLQTFVYSPLKDSYANIVCVRGGRGHAGQ